MKNKSIIQHIFIGLIFVCLTASAAFAQTTAFTYQGKLTDSGPPQNNYQMRFELYDAVTGGNQIGATVTNPAVAVSQGVFTVSLDFGAVAFDGTDRFIEIAVKRLAGDPFTVLTPRHKINSTPYAVKSKSSETADTATNALNLGGLAANTYLLTNGDGSSLTNLNGANITNNTINASALATDSFPKSRNLLLLGSLRWDILRQRVSVGADPFGVAFDGANIWVANNSSNNVTKLRVSDGVVQGTFAVGIRPFGIAFDGANIWVANSGSNNVTKLRADDGANLGTFAIGNVPIGIAFDGTYIWVTNGGSNLVRRLRVSDNQLFGTFVVGNNPSAVAFDGTNIWVANEGSNNVTKLRVSDGVVQGTFAVGIHPRGIAFDGENIWVANYGSDNVTKLLAKDGTLLTTFGIGSYPTSLAFDGTNIWVANIGGNDVRKIRVSDNQLDGIFAVNNPTSLAFDGTNIWVTNSETIGSVTKLPVFP